MASNQHFFGRPRFLFPSTSKSKICPIYSLLRFTWLNQRSLLHVNIEFRLFSFSRLRKDFVLARCSFLVLHIHKSIALSLHSKYFFLPFWGHNILMNEASSLWHSCYIWPSVFKKIALQVSTGINSLNFLHAERYLLIVASSQPVLAQIESPRQTKLSTTSSLLSASCYRQYKVINQLLVHYQEPLYT